MLLIWRVAGVLAAVVTNLIASSLFREDNYFQRHAWAQAAALWGSGVACWLLGRYLHGKPGRTLIDKATGGK